MVHVEEMGKYNMGNMKDKSPKWQTKREWHILSLGLLRKRVPGGVHEGMLELRRPDRQVRIN